ncbi:MAG: radical SAM protein [Lachnospiraceae bacterium]|nr:radical SAM protein [Lachnospiraceae bacterium]
MSICSVCFHHCDLQEGQTGLCLARTCRGGAVVPANYGLLTSLALDPIEKKPLRRFHPGARILSVGSYGCNLRCPFCQNHEISWSKEAEGIAQSAVKVYGRSGSAEGFGDRDDLARMVREVSPEELAALAAKLQPEGNIGVAYTYNEPLTGYEYVRDCGKLVHELGMKNVLVTNGTAEPAVCEELLPYIDAMNIDLKGFTDRFYSMVGGSLSMTKDFIETAVSGGCHVELTCLVIPGENDSEEEMEEMSAWIASLDGGKGEIPLHISRFFPAFHMTDRPATEVARVYRLADVARRKLKDVYTGNC